jgi:tRNA nucleotidyltransferase (CCA-adding enzyme)
MKVVITHSNADCDAFASQIALQSLRPETTVILSRRVAPRVHQFLNLHRDVFELRTLEEIDVDAVSQISVVDARARARLGEHRALLDRLDTDNRPVVEVWDHHEPSDDELPVDTAHFGEVGATTTMLVEALKRKGVTIDAVRATLFALGIHVDTGSLTYDTTTFRDAAALEWLVEQGARPEVLETYLRLAFSDAQREAFMRLMGSIEIEEYHGISVGIGGVTLEHGVDGLALVTTQALRLHNIGALFGAFHIKGKKLQIVGRSTVESVNVGQLLRALGGGGHSAAGAATIKTTDPFVEISKLRAGLESANTATRTIDEFIIQDVPCVAGGMAIEDAARKMEEMGTTFVFVEDEGEFVGAFDDSFVAKAREGGRSDLPVKSSMHHSVPAIEAGTPLHTAVERFRNENKGLLLVRDGDGRALGALHRRDCMQSLYED